MSSSPPDRVVPLSHRIVENARVVTIQSSVGHAETLARLFAGIEQRGLTLFARFDHAAAARAAGLKLGDEDVLVLGDPRAGTPLMQGDPAVGIELPLRMLVWSDSDGTTIGYNDPRELASQFELAGREQVLEAMAKLLSELASQAVR